MIFRKENQEYHLRKLAAGPYRDCDRCGDKALTGHEFEAHQFYCEPCRSALHAEQERQWKERDRKAEATHARRAKRIAELKAQTNLNDTDVKELAALMVSEADGAERQLADFIFDGINRY